MKEKEEAAIKYLRQHNKLPACLFQYIILNHMKIEQIERRFCKSERTAAIT